VASTHMIVLPGGGYAGHSPHEAEPVARWLGEIGVQASVFRYPVNVRHPVPLAPGAAPDQTVQFAVLGYAITSMETETYRPARLILLGEDASPQLRRSTSLDALVTPASPPFFIWHTAEDAYVLPEHTYRLGAALAASQVPHAAHMFAHGPHGLGLAQGAGAAAIWTTLAGDWIHEQS
jgi:hypothetical protein